MGSAVTSTRPAATGPASAVDASAFRQAMGSFATGVTVVTVACDDGDMHGMTVNSFTSASLDPMLVLVCLNETSRGVSLIRAGRQLDRPGLAAGLPRGEAAVAAVAARSVGGAGFHQPPISSS
jgi:hypothetical protein